MILTRLNQTCWRSKEENPQNEGDPTAPQRVFHCHQFLQGGCTGAVRELCQETNTVRAGIQYASGIVMLTNSNEHVGCHAN